MTAKLAWKYFSEHFNNITSQTVPTAVTYNKPKFKNFYMNREAMRNRKKKQLCWNRYRATSDPIDYARFAQERNKLRKLTRKLQKDYESHLAYGIKRNPKAFWRYVNSKLKTRPSIESLKLDNGTEAVTDQEKADALNSHFSSVFTNEDISSIPLIDDIYASSPITDISISDNNTFTTLSRSRRHTRAIFILI